mmetsp:Transcript_11411/g.32057  ORF Transcript_11411/g.32057 Transcript_11411/m.32057 type:complete len:246 (-) Transcript_11411:688-1425(-)
MIHGLRQVYARHAGKNGNKGYEENFLALPKRQYRRHQQARAHVLGVQELCRGNIQGVKLVKHIANCVARNIGCGYRSFHDHLLFHLFSFGTWGLDVVIMVNKLKVVARKVVAGKNEPPVVLCIRYEACALLISRPHQTLPELLNRLSLGDRISEESDDRRSIQALSSRNVVLRVNMDFFPLNLNDPGNIAHRRKIHFSLPRNRSQARLRNHKGIHSTELGIPHATQPGKRGENSQLVVRAGYPLT